MDSLEAAFELGPVGRRMEGIGLELFCEAAFEEGGEDRLDTPGWGISAGAIIEEEDGGKEREEGSSISGSESESSSTRACDMTWILLYDDDELSRLV